MQTMLVGPEIDPNAMGEGSGEAVWREGFNGISVEGGEAISLMNRGKNNGVANTPIRSAHSHLKGKGDRNLLPPSQHPSKSTVDEGDACCWLMLMRTRGAQWCQRCIVKAGKSLRGEHCIYEVIELC